MSDRMPMLAGTALLVIGLGVRHFPEGLHHAGCALGTAGGGLFTFSDTGWSPAAPFVNSGRQTGAVCRPVCTVTFMLAGDLSAGRMGWCGMGTQASFIALTVVATLSLVTAVLIWRPEHEVYAQVHSHKDPETNNESTHEHDFVIDDEHPSSAEEREVISQKKDNVSGEDKPIKSVTMALIHIILSLPPERINHDRSCITP